MSSKFSPLARALRTSYSSCPGAWNSMLRESALEKTPQHRLPRVGSWASGPTHSSSTRSGTAGRPLTSARSTRRPRRRESGLHSQAWPSLSASRPVGSPGGVGMGPLTPEQFSGMAPEYPEPRSERSALLRSRLSAASSRRSRRSYRRSRRSRSSSAASARCARSSRLAARRARRLRSHSPLHIPCRCVSAFRSASTKREAYLSFG